MLFNISYDKIFQVSIFYRLKSPKRDTHRPGSKNMNVLNIENKIISYLDLQKHEIKL